MRTLGSLLRPALTLLLLAGLAPAQVHYFPDGRPWNGQANAGPDAEVEGWLYNLGVTGIRVKLVEEAPKGLVVGHVFDKSPAAGKVKEGDVIVGAGGAAFMVPHRNGYGMQVFGPQGPVEDFARALDAALGSDKRRLKLELIRKGKRKEVELKLPAKATAYEASFPFDCERTAAVREALCDYLLEHQRKDGSFGNPVHDTFAPLALLANGRKKDLKAVERNVRWHAKNTSTEDDSWLVNWKYMAAGIVMSEWHLATGDVWVIEELQEVYDFLCTTQYLDLTQVSEKVKESHPHAYPKDAMQQHGGWGHNPGFEGYGPIAMITAQGALAFALMEKCGIAVDEERHRAAYAFLDRGTGANGYLWYNDQAAGQQDWADMGRTGASSIAHLMSADPKLRAKAARHIQVMSEHPDSFPDTHASPLMGMGYGALGTYPDRGAFKKLMAANRWWFVLAECPDGSFHYQPNRDNNGYGDDARLLATATTALILTLPLEGLAMTGKMPE